MVVIGIETSGLSGSVALCRDGECLELRSLSQAGQRHAQAMVLELKNVIQSQDLTAQDIDAIAVSRGPGSFTGLRVGLVCAKTFAYAVRCQFVAVDTFAAVAMNCPENVSSIWVVEDAQRGELFAARYQRDGGGSWIQTTPIAIVSGQAWLDERSADDIVTGRGLARCDILRVRARCLPDNSIACPSATIIAQLGERRLLLRNPLDSSDPDFDLWKALPFYMRPSAAEEQRDKRLATP